MPTKYEASLRLHRLFYEAKSKVDPELINLFESGAIAEYRVEQISSDPLNKEAIRVGLSERELQRLLREAAYRAFESPETPERKARMCIWMMINGETGADFELPLGNRREGDVVGRLRKILGEVGRTTVDRFACAIENDFSKVVILESNTLNLHVFSISPHARMLVWQTHYLMSLQGACR